MQAARRAVDHVDAAQLELLGVGHRVVHGPAAVQPIDRRDAQEQRLVLGPRGAHRLRHLEGKARAAGEVAAVGIVARVRQRRQKLMHQIAVRIVNLEDVEAGLQRTLGGVGPMALEGCQVVNRELPRHDVARRHRLGRRRHGLPAPLSACQVVGRQRPVAEPGPLHGAFTARMRDLDGRHHPLRPHEVGDALERRDVRRRPQPHVAVGDAALRGNRGGLDEDAAGAAERQPAEVREVPVLGDAVDGGIGGHRRDHHPIGECQGANGDGGKQQRLGHVGMGARRVVAIPHAGTARERPAGQVIAPKLRKSRCSRYAGSNP